MTHSGSVRRCLRVESDAEFEKKYQKIGRKPALRAYLVKNRMNRQLAVARLSWIQDGSDIARLFHPNVATIQQVYDGILMKILIHEYLPLNLLQILKLTELTEVEVASAVTQVFSYRTILSYILSADIRY